MHINAKDIEVGGFNVHEKYKDAKYELTIREKIR